MATNIWDIVYMVFKSIEYTQVITYEKTLLFSSYFQASCHSSLPHRPPPRALFYLLTNRTIPHPGWDWKGHSFLYTIQLSHLIMHILQINMFKIIVLNLALNNFSQKRIKYNIAVASLVFMAAHSPCWHFGVESTSQSNRV